MTRHGRSRPSARWRGRATIGTSRATGDSALDEFGFVAVDGFESFDAKSDALIDLQATQRQLANNGALSAQQKTDLLATISDLELTLGKSAAQMVAGDVMTEDEFSTQSAQLGEERKNVLLRLTDQILGRSPQIGSKDRS